MRSSNTFEIYKASAGSGKTFSLTLHFLELALRHPLNYRHILAVTFTNKATAEMKERIMEVLHGLATNSSEAESYRAALMQRMQPLKPADLYEKARQVYANILHDYSRFSVTTIDSFVQRIIRGFAWELGIDGGFKLQLNTEPVKEALADKLNQRLDDDPHLQQWVVDMARERLGEGKRWEFREDMLKLSEELFKETFRKFEDGLKDLSADEVKQRFSELNRKVNLAIRTIEKKWKEAGAAGLSLLQQNGLQVEDFAYGKSSFATYFLKAKDGIPAEPGARVLGVIDDASKMLPKGASASSKSILDSISLPLQRALQQLVDWYKADLPHYNTAISISKNLAMLRLMHVFAQELGSYRKENNSLLISDTHYLLRKLTEDTSASFIYEKTGQRYKHYLIDEFQDTSAFQWDNFVPLLTEALSYGHYNLVVGDVKQAIYRWRNGDWRLLLYKVQERLKDFQPGVKTLQENYRSASQVISFNNLLFYVAPHLLQQELNASMSTADDRTQQQLQEPGYPTIFNDAYADSFQQAPHFVKHDGLVQFQWLAESEDESYDEQVLPQLYLKVQELMKEGYVASDIAVLTRTNKEAQAVVEYLVAAQQEGHNQFKVLSGDALMLSGNQAVQIIICAMRWLHNSRHSIALAQLRQLVMLQKGLPSDRLEVYASKGDNSLLPDDFFGKRTALRSLPLNELLHQLILLFELHKHPQHNPYILALSDKLQEWVRYGEASLQEFLQYWDDEGIKLSLPANAKNNALEVVTVHKSKGLAYNIVLMPFIDWDIVPSGGPMAPTLWADNRQTDFNDIPVLPINYQKSLANSDFALAYYEEFVLSAMDNLNVLYVAFTRAKKRIYGWSPFKEKKKSSEGFPYRNIGELIYAVATSSMQLPNDQYEETRKGFDANQLTWKFGEAMPNLSPALQPPDTQVHQLQYTHWKEKLQVRYQALAGDTDHEIVLPRKQGILLHDILSRLNTPSQLNEVLDQVKREGWMDDYQQQKISQVIEDVLKLDALGPWHSGQYLRLAERSIINPDRQLRRPDLILYNENACLVYDFKFTTSDNDKVKHDKQVREYMGMLLQMGFANVQGFVIYGLEKKSIAIN